MLSFPLIATCVFFLAILVIAVWGMTKTRDVNDFFLGGRTLGPWILAISYGAAYFSAVVFIGFAGTYGWQCSFKSLWVGVMNALVGSLAAWLVLGKATRKMTRRLNASTTPEFFAARYDSNLMKIVGAIAIFFFLLPYSSAVFAGLTYLFQEVFHISLTCALTFVTIMTGVYLILGGYKAAARIDFLQGAVMFFGAIAMLLFVVFYFGKQFDGVGNAFENAARFYSERVAGERDPIQTTPFQPIPNLIFWSVVFMTSISPWGMPQMVHKFYAIKDEKQIVKGAVVCCAFAFVIGVAAYGVGSFSHLMESDVLRGTLTAQGGIDVQKLVPTLLVQCLPRWFLAIVLLLVLSASTSTLCSLALTSSAALSVDLVKGYIAPKASDRSNLFVFRLCCAVFIILSYFIALYNPSWIVALTSLSWGAVAGGFLAPYVYGLFWRGTTKAGAIAGMATGLIVANGFYWGFFIVRGAAMAKAYAPLGASLAMVVPFIVVPLVSLATRKLPAELVSKAFDDPKEPIEESQTKKD